MTPQKANFKKFVGMTLIVLIVGIFATIPLSPVANAEGGAGGINPPPNNLTDTTTVTAMGDNPAIFDETVSESVSYTLWDSIVTALYALI